MWRLVRSLAREVSADVCHCGCRWPLVRMQTCLETGVLHSCTLGWRKAIRKGFDKLWGQGRNTQDAMGERVRGDWKLRKQTEPRDDQTEWSKSDRARQISYDITYMWNLKEWPKWTYLQNGNRLTDLENKFMVTRQERLGRDKLGGWDYHIHTTI